MRGLGNACLVSMRLGGFSPMGKIHQKGKIHVLGFVWGLRDGRQPARMEAEAFPGECDTCALKVHCSSPEV